MGVPVVQGLLEGGVDDVVRRGHDVAECADAAQVIAVSAEGADVGHGWDSFRGAMAGDVVVLWRAFPEVKGERGA